MSRYCIYILLFSLNFYAQGTLPIYHDYLSDNIFLIHPTAAGMSNSADLRITHRQQWNNNTDSPSLQTLSIHNRFKEHVGAGLILFNDRNGFHSQTGIQAAYAYHLNFGRDEALDQLSFALSGSYVNNRVDQRSFVIPDPVISRIVESDSYLNFDFSAAYFYLDGYAYFTVKNLLLNSRSSINKDFESINLRRYLLNIGYFLGWRKRTQIEPSIMLQYTEYTEELTIDVNAKLFKLLSSNKRLWFAISYRRSFDDNDIQELNQLTAIAGLEYKRYLLSYTYSYQLGSITFQNGGFHQFTFGINLFQKRPKDRGYIPEFNPYMFETKN